MNTITINGQTITTDGATRISIRNGEVRLDGKLVADKLPRDVVCHVVQWDGPLASLEVSGDAHTGDVSGNVKANGSVTCRDVGAVRADGSVRCGKVGGNITAGGSVTVS